MAKEQPQHKKPFNKAYFENLLRVEQEKYKILEANTKQLGNQYVTSTETFNKIIAGLKDDIKKFQQDPEHKNLQEGVRILKQNLKTLKVDARKAVAAADVRAAEDRQKLHDEIADLKKELQEGPIPQK